MSLHWSEKNLQRRTREDWEDTADWISWVLLLLAVAYFGWQMGRAFVGWNWPVMG